jgi:hypothetical protein
MKRKNSLVLELKNEVKDFYNLEVTNEITLEFVEFYFHYKRNPVIDTTEREDFMLYLQDLDLVKLK